MGTAIVDNSFHTSVEHFDPDVSLVGNFEIMRHAGDGPSFLMSQSKKSFDHAGTVVAVEIAGRLIPEDQCRIIG